MIMKRRMHTLKEKRLSRTTQSLITMTMTMKRIVISIQIAVQTGNGFFSHHVRKGKLINIRVTPTQVHLHMIQLMRMMIQKHHLVPMLIFHANVRTAITSYVMVQHLLLFVIIVLLLTTKIKRERETCSKAHIFL